MNIGVLDDDKNICQMIKAVLELQGDTVYAYSDPTNFTTSLIPRNIHQLEHIIVDFHLIGPLSGVELIREVRKYHPHLPAILISANVLPQTLVQELSEVRILQKPFPLINLIQIVKQA